MFIVSIKKQYNSNLLKIMKTKAKIGLFGIGLDTYWDQFDGLKDKLTGYQNQIKAKIESFGVDVVDAGLIDNPIDAPQISFQNVTSLNKSQ